MDYDVLILGGGIIGCSIAYELSKFSLNIALIEREYDIASDVSVVNSAIVYDGVECSDSVMSKLEVMGNSMFREITSKFNIPFKKTGSFIVAQDEDEVNRLEKIYDRAVKRGISGIEIIDGQYMEELEPAFKAPVKKALYSRNTGVVCPYDLAIAYGEVAFENGVNFKLEEEVIDIQKISKGFRVITNKNKFTCRTVINTTPGKNYSIDNKNYKEVETSNTTKLNYILLKRSYRGSFSNVIFTMDKEDWNLSTIPTLQGNTLVSIESKTSSGFMETVSRCLKYIEEIQDNDLKNFYKTHFHRDPIVIDDSLIDKGYAKITGKHYAEVTMTPAIAKVMCETMVNTLKCMPKKEFIDKRREVFKFRNMSNIERNRLIQMDKSYGKVICTCQQVTEGEIIDAIRRPLGARTLEGIKRRTGVTLGNCHGAYCTDKIVSILARETNKNPLDIVKNSRNSKIFSGRIKEFDEM